MNNVYQKNLKILRRKYNLKWNYRTEERSSIKLESNIDKANNIIVKSNGKSNYLLSKFSIKQEATRTLKISKNIDKSEYIIVMGIGLGQIIESCLELYPKKKIIIYEPSDEIFDIFLRHTDLKCKEFDQVLDIFVGEKNTKQFVSNIIRKVFNGGMTFAILPGYKKLFADKIKEVTSQFVEAFEDQKYKVNINLCLEKKWTLNAINNIDYTVKCKSILKEGEGKFTNKPVLIISAGPSLEKEYNNLKYIIENNLAYTVAVGSACRALGNKGIFPDAFMSFDPNPANGELFQYIIEKGYDHVPLIFGTTIYPSILSNYRGPKRHFLVTADKVVDMLSEEKVYEYDQKIYDSPTVAVSAMQVLSRLKFSPIIFVGQNLAFVDKQEKAKEVDSTQVWAKDKELEEKIEVESVEGGIITTSQMYERMRKNLQDHIKFFPQIDFINTTQKGAKIEGTRYKTLKRVIEEELAKTQTLSQDEIKSFNDMFIEYKDKEVLPYFNLSLFREQERVISLLEDSIQNIEAGLKINESKKLDVQNLSKLMDNIIKTVKELDNNIFYSKVVRQMNLARVIILNQSFDEKYPMRYKDTEVLETLIREFNVYFKVCLNDLEQTKKIMKL